MDALQKLFNWADDNHYLTTTNGMINNASKQVTNMEIELAQTKERLATAERLLSWWINNYDEIQPDPYNMGVPKDEIETVTNTRTFLSAHTLPDYVLVRQEDIRTILIQPNTSKGFQVKARFKFALEKS